MKTSKIIAQTDIWNEIARWCLYGVFLLTPLFFLPLTIFPVTMNKQLLLVVLVFLAFIAWLVGGVTRGQLAYTKTSLNWLIAAMAAWAAVSAWFSGAHLVGLFGISGGEVDVFINVLALGLLFFLTAAVFNKEEDIWKVLRLVFLAAAVVTIFSLLQFFEIWILPWSFTKSVVFNTVGTANALAIYLGAIFIMLATLLYLNLDRISQSLRTALMVLAVAVFLVSFAIGFWVVSAGIILAMIALIAFDVAERKNKKEFGRRGFLPLILLALSLLVVLSSFEVIAFRLPAFSLPPEATTGIQASFDVARGSFRESVKNYIIGSGPATFQYKYSLYRNPIVNLYPFWGARFTQAVNAVLTYLNNWGLPGLLLFLAFIGLLVKESWQMADRLAKKFGALFWAILFGLVYLLLALFFYPQNFILYLMIFGLAGLLFAMRSIDSGFKTLSLVDPPQRTFILSLGALVLIMFVASLTYFHGQRYVAAVYFEKGLIMANAGDLEKALPLIKTALDLDSSNDSYIRALSNVHVAKINALYKETGANPQDLQARFTDNLSAAVQMARRAIEANKLYSANHANLAQIYENVIPLVNDAAEQSFASYADAIALDPTNPVLFTNLGRAHYSYAQKLKQGGGAQSLVNDQYNLSTAKIERGIQLKIDYADAHFLLIKILEEQNKISEAITKADRLKYISGGDASVLFQLGLLYYQANRFNEARRELETAISGEPDYANARYFLGLTYDKLGLRGEAIKQFEHIKKTNEDNAEVKNILKNLRDGKPALEGVSGASLEEGLTSESDGEENDVSGGVAE